MLRTAQLEDLTTINQNEDALRLGNQKDLKVGKLDRLAQNRIDQSVVTEFTKLPTT